MHSKQFRAIPFELTSYLPKWWENCFIKVTIKQNVQNKSPVKGSRYLIMDDELNPT
ncbi:hypothetical protein Scep_016748 [Stephania cephalantha]|uniref:Uncharacterized protein n=1 Tax=Stephania cephalantha TaxID=152367 RepID=A0AAP0INS0_9MAGN